MENRTQRDGTTWDILTIFLPADCTAPLTTEVLVEQRDFVGAKYTSGTELDACLSAEVLRDALETLGKVDFQDGPLQALKWKLDKVERCLEQAGQEG